MTPTGTVIVLHYNLTRVQDRSALYFWHGMETHVFVSVEHMLGWLKHDQHLTFVQDHNEETGGGVIYFNDEMKAAWAHYAEHDLNDAEYID